MSPAPLSHIVHHLRQGGKVSPVRESWPPAHWVLPASTAVRHNFLHSRRASGHERVIWREAEHPSLKVLNTAPALDPENFFFSKGGLQSEVGLGLS